MSDQNPEVKKKYLKVTKYDTSVHIVPTDNKPFYQSWNNKITEPSKKMKFEDVSLTDHEFENYPAFDNDYVTADDAQAKIDRQAREIEHLKMQLAAKADPNGSNGAKNDPASASTPYSAESPMGNTQSTDDFNKDLTNLANGNSGAVQNADKGNVADTIALIEAAKTLEDLDVIMQGETRITVVRAAEKKSKELAENNNA